MTLPLPVRLAAGLVAIAVEQVRELPRTVIELPVTAVSQALQASMRVQQRITELAIKGDRALGALRPVEEKPSWATFDEDEAPRRNGASTVTPLRPTVPGVPVTPDGPGRPVVVGRPVVPAVPVVPAAPVVPAGPVVPAVPVMPAAPVVSRDEPAGPNILPGYGELTIPQLRGRLRHLSLDELRALLEYEDAHGARPPYLTMLANRITTVTAE